MKYFLHLIISSSFLYSMHEDSSSYESIYNFSYDDSSFERLVNNPNLERGSLNNNDWKDKLRDMIREWLRHESIVGCDAQDITTVLNLTPTPWNSDDLITFFHELAKSDNVDDGQECEALLEYTITHGLNINLIFQEGIKITGINTLVSLMTFAVEQRINMDTSHIIASCFSLKEKISAEDLGPDYLGIFLNYANNMGINLGHYNRGTIRGLANKWFEDERDDEEETKAEKQKVEKLLMENRRF